MIMQWAAKELMDRRDNWWHEGKISTLESQLLHAKQQKSKRKNKRNVSLKARIKSLAGALAKAKQAYAAAKLIKLLECR